MPHAFVDETIITWSDAEIGTDIALSFQEAGGCDTVWYDTAAHALSTQILLAACTAYHLLPCTLSCCTWLVMHVLAAAAVVIACHSRLRSVCMLSKASLLTVTCQQMHPRASHMFLTMSTGAFAVILAVCMLVIAGSRL